MPKVLVVVGPKVGLYANSSRGESTGLHYAKGLRGGTIRMHYAKGLRGGTIGTHYANGFHGESIGMHYANGLHGESIGDALCLRSLWRTTRVRCAKGPRDGVHRDALRQRSSWLDQRGVPTPMALVVSP
jgi:hypothetical protein